MLKNTFFLKTRTTAIHKAKHKVSYKVDDKWSKKGDIERDDILIMNRKSSNLYMNILYIKYA